MISRLLAIALVSLVNLIPAALVSITSLPPIQSISQQEFRFEDPLRVYRDLRVPNLLVNYFDIHGTTAEALRAEMDAQGPKNMKGHICDAFTKWQVNWNWPLRQGKPVYDETEVKLALEVFFPRWVPEEGAQAGLAERWRNFSLAVAQHELGHIEQALSAYHGLREKIVAAAKDNPGLSPKEANALAMRYVSQMQAADNRYDELTDRGKRQGTKFP